MPSHPLKNTLKTVQTEGPLGFSKECFSFLKEITKQFLYHTPRMWLEYGGIRPKPTETVGIDPECIEYRIGSKYLPSNAPRYGILSGDWDTYKTHWENDSFYGLVERFRDHKEWEDTIYYQKCVDKLSSGGTLHRLDGPQTLENFHHHLDDLDELYHDIKQNGYDSSSIITVCIGRDGEWMVYHGHHRHTLARVIGIKEVPVRIKYRHEQWQKLRKEIYTNGFSAKQGTALRQHPDLRNIPV